VALQPLGDQEIDAGLATLASVWRRDGNAIVAELECSDFAAAIALVNAIAAQAERADHHPDILIHGYRRLTITLSTHAAGGLTQRDFALAGAIDALAVE
jgi:4a-hydroxytetrahydrobiopterin dehydratase